VTLDEFRATLTHASPPSGLKPALVALWHDARGDWTTAHAVAQEITDRSGAWVHAYLHRKEGDISNAGYWYRVAKESLAEGPHAEEWAEIVGQLLEDA
jgi:hypothetical protein